MMESWNDGMLGKSYFKAIISEPIICHWSFVISKKIYGLPEKCRRILTNDY
jgi:hypothetical protein